MKEYKSLYREVVNLRRTKKGAIYSIMTNRIHIVSQEVHGRCAVGRIDSVVPESTEGV